MATNNWYIIAYVGDQITYYMTVDDLRSGRQKR